jgi:hypothetical protein
LFCLELSTSKEAVNSSSTFSASSASFYDGAWAQEKVGGCLVYVLGVSG